MKYILKNNLIGIEFTFDSKEMIVNELVEIAVKNSHNKSITDYNNINIEYFIADYSIDIDGNNSNEESFENSYTLMKFANNKFKNIISERERSKKIVKTNSITANHEDDSEKDTLYKKYDYLIKKTHKSDERTSKHRIIIMQLLISKFIPFHQIAKYFNVSKKTVSNASKERVAGRFNNFYDMNRDSDELKSLINKISNTYN